MRKFKNICLLACALVVFSSCELDNYDAPNVSLHGSFFDNVTGELVEQDIVGGTKIIFVERGFKNPEEQNMVVKTDGTYRNELMFAGEYDLYFNESNFVLPDTLKRKELKQKENKLDFIVQPYIRITNKKIERIGNKIIATFSIKPTVDKKVKQVGLFAHVDYVVGDRFKLVESKLDVNAIVADETEYKLEIDLDSSNGSKLKSNKEYYFRVGALIEGNGARYNYASAVKITI